MKIIQLTAENIKRLVAVDITPGDVPVVTIAGKNGHGKSSVLDSIWWVLAGTSHIQSEPIRRGATKARVRLNLGELIAERKFTEKGTTLSVTSADGAKFGSPQKLLDDLVGELSFDPLAFCNAAPKDQFDELAVVAKVGTDLDDIDRRIAGLYDQRTGVNREAAAARARADGIVVPPRGEEQEVDEVALVEQLELANTLNEQANTAAKNLAYVEQLAARADDDAIEADERAAKAQAEADAFRTRAAELRKERDAMVAQHGEPRTVDITEFTEALKRARTVNAFLANRSRVAAQRNEADARAKELEDHGAELTAKIDMLRRDRQAAIEAATIPVPGLSFGQGELLFNDLPLDQASDSEKIRVGMAVAMAANPKLRVVRIKNGSLLDSASMGVIASMAAEHDYQVWIERVDETGKVGFTIEDGRLAGADLTQE